jgi:hypothetical protein
VKSFVDRKSIEQHESYHKRVRDLVSANEIVLPEPELLIPQVDEEDAENVHENGIEIKSENTAKHNV